MENYEWVRKVPVNKLSNRSLVLVSRFARQLKKVNGRVLALTSPEMPINLVREAQMAGDPDLNLLLNSLLDEFFDIAEREGLTAASITTAKPLHDRANRGGQADSESSVSVNH